ncbi:MAG: asparagine synthase-related protein [Dehalococcoidia bacterium]
MSGVLALVSLDGRPVPEDLARRQLAAIRHRGAGEPVLWLEPGVALGQAHRAITPEAEREVLPLVSPDGRYHLVWDGRIDNRDELARLLGWSPERAGEATDADFVLEAYVRWGDACVTRLLGDWAIVIWDSVAHRLFAAKDPMGFRSLYYAQHDGLFVVGSEPLQVLDASWLPPRPNFDYVLRLLGDAVIEPGTTSYEELTELLGGQTCTVEDGLVSKRTFWRSPRVTDVGARTAEDYIEGFIERFDDAVRVRVRSAGPVGVFLSGGLDSSYVAAIASKYTNVTAVSTYAGGTDWDEREYQRLVVDHLGIPYESVDVEDCWALSSRYLSDQHFDVTQIPPQAPMQVAQARFAGSLGMRVMLTGDGGDEWMVGGRRVHRGRPRRPSSSASHGAAHASRPAAGRRSSAGARCVPGAARGRREGATSSPRREAGSQTSICRRCSPASRMASMYEGPTVWSRRPYASTTGRSYNGSTGCWPGAIAGVPSQTATTWRSPSTTSEWWSTRQARPTG